MQRRATFVGSAPSFPSCTWDTHLLRKFHFLFFRVVRGPSSSPRAARPTSQNTQKLRVMLNARSISQPKDSIPSLQACPSDKPLSPSRRATPSHVRWERPLVPKLHLGYALAPEVSLPLFSRRARSIFLSARSSPHKPEHAKAESHAERAKHLTTTARSPFPLGSTRLEAPIPHLFPIRTPTRQPARDLTAKGQHSFVASLPLRQASFSVAACNAEPRSLGAPPRSQVALGIRTCSGSFTSSFFARGSIFLSARSSPHKPEHAKAESHAERAKHLTTTARSPFPLGSTRLEAPIPHLFPIRTPTRFIGSPRSISHQRTAFLRCKPAPPTSLFLRRGVQRRATFVGSAPSFPSCTWDTHLLRKFHFPFLRVLREAIFLSARSSPHKPEHAKAESHAERAKHLTTTARSPFPLGSTRLEAPIPHLFPIRTPTRFIGSLRAPHSEGQHSFVLSLPRRQASFIPSSTRNPHPASTPTKPPSFTAATDCPTAKRCFGFFRPFSSSPSPCGGRG